MYVVFTVSKRLKKLVSNREKYSLSEANRVVSELDRFVEQKQFKEVVTIKIVNENGLIFTEEYSLGLKKARNILLMVRDTLNTTFSDVSQEEKDSLLQLLENHLGSQIVPKPLDKELIQSTTKKEVSNKVVKEKRVKVKLPSFLKKNVLRITISVLLVLVIGVLVFQTYQSYSLANNKKDVPIEKKTFEDYFTEKDYIKALEISHSKDAIDKVVNQLVSEENFKTLKKVNDQYPSIAGTFELAFLNHDWEQVIEIPIDYLSDDRKVMVAHAYVEVGKLEEAETLNELIQSSIIKKEIQSGYFNRAMDFLRNKEISKAEDIQKNLQDDSLSKYIDEAKTYVKLIDSYEEKKETDSAKQWLKILQNLGKE